MQKLKFIGEWLYGTRRKLATWGLFLFAAYLAVHVIFGANGWMVYEKKKAEYRQVNAEIERIKQDNEQLSKNINALQNDKKAIEREARTSMGYARDNEVVIILPGAKGHVAVNAENKTPQK